MHENEKKKDKRNLSLVIKCASCGKEFETTLSCEDLGIKRMPSRIYNFAAMVRSKRFPSTLEIKCPLCDKKEKYEPVFEKCAFGYKKAKKNKAERKA